VIQSHPDRIPKEPIEGKYPIQKQKSERQVNEKQNNHNDCFIEAHYKILDKEQAANNSINRMQKERITMVNQLNRMIKIDTVPENTKINNNDIGYETTENNNNDDIIKTQQVQVTRKRSDTETKDMKHQVLEPRRVVQGSQAKNDNNLTGFLLWPYIYGHFLGSFFYGSISPSKIGLIAPYLEQTQLRSKARAFLLH
jgi:hypothetical protein